MCVCFVVAGKSGSEVSDGARDVGKRYSGDVVEEERENIENCDKFSPDLTANSSQKKEYVNISVIGQSAGTNVTAIGQSAAVVSGCRESRQRRRPKSFLRSATRKTTVEDIQSAARSRTEKDIQSAARSQTEKDIQSAARSRTEEDIQSAARSRTEKDITVDAVTGDIRETVEVFARHGQDRVAGLGDVVTGVGDVVSGASCSQSLNEERQLQQLDSHEIMSPAARDILQIIDDTGSSTQLSTECRSNVVVLSDNQTTRKLPSNAAELRTSDASAAVDVDKLSSSGNCVDVGGNAASDTPVNVDVGGNAASDTPVNSYKCIVDVSSPLSRRSLRKTCSEAANNCFIVQKKRQTRLSTPGRAGNLRQTTPGRAGNQRKNPGRARNIIRTTPGRVGNSVHTTVGRAGNLGVASPGCVSNVGQVTPGHAASKRRCTLGDTPATSREGLAVTPHSTTQMNDVASALSPAISRLMSCSPALKRNAKGETALHRAAIKVL